MDPLKSNTRSAFKWNRSERRGMVVLLLIMLLIWAAYRIVDKMAFEQDMETLRPHLAIFRQERASFKERKLQESKVEFRSFFFDPNTASQEELRSLGMPDYLASRILKFRSAGGRFYKPEDLSRIYGMKQGLSDRLMPWIQIQNLPERKKIVSAETEVAAAVEINSADSLDWQRLKGIGPVLASRIMHYRELLGGFHRIEQLKEIYGIRDSLFEIIRPQVRIDSHSSLQRIDVNHVNLAELKKHPYFRNYTLCQALLRYRDAHGPFQDPEALKGVHLMNDSILDRIRPYIVIIP